MRRIYTVLKQSCTAVLATTSFRTTSTAFSPKAASLPLTVLYSIIPCSTCAYLLLICSTCVAHARCNAIYCDQQCIPQTLILRIMSQSLQNLHLQHIDRVYVWVAHVNQVSEHLIVLVEPMMSCQLQQHGNMLKFGTTLSNMARSCISD